MATPGPRVPPAAAHSPGSMEFSFTLRNVMVGSSILGVVGGVMGSFALLRRQSLLGDALAHAALPGVCLAFLVSGTKDPAWLLTGAMITGVMGAAFIQSVIRTTRIKEDAAMGIVLSVFFGVGVVMLTRLQKQEGGNQSGLDKYLFGQAATLMEEDIRVMAVLMVVVLALVACFYKEFKLLVFDRDFGASLGFPMRFFDLLLTSLLVVVVVVGLQTVGVVLMVAALITPAAAARQWTDRLGWMIVIASVIGSISGIAGSLASAQAEDMPTGPAIVLTASGFLGVSLLFAPRRGMLWAWRNRRFVTNRIRVENFLKDLYAEGEAGERWREAVSDKRLLLRRGRGTAEVARVSAGLAAMRFVEISHDGIRLTETGHAEAERLVRSHRLWELYLTRRLDLPGDHVHRDAEDMEHALSSDAIDQIERLLGYPRHDPHGRPIPRARIPQT